VREAVAQSKRVREATAVPAMLQPQQSVVTGEIDQTKAAAVLHFIRFSRFTTMMVSAGWWTVQFHTNLHFE